MGNKSQTCSSQTSSYDLGTPKLDEISKLMRRSFAEHVTGLVFASMSGVRVVEDSKLKNTEMVIHASPDAFAALKEATNDDG